MTHTKILSFAFPATLLLILLLSCAVCEATVQRLDICNVSFQPSQAVPVIREATSFVTVRGDLVNTNTGIDKPSGIAISVVDSAGGGGLNTFIVLKIQPAASAGTGNHTIKIHYLVELHGPDVFTINVLAPKITSISINPSQSTIPQGTAVTVTASGSDLTNMHLQSPFAGIQNIHITSTTSSSLVFTGTAQQTFSIRSVSYKNSALPDSCTSNFAAGSALLNVTVSGGTPPPQPLPPPSGGGGRPPAPQPDLSPILLNTFRSGTDFSNNEQSTYNLCPNPTPNPKVSTIPPLTIRVLNGGNANVTTPFTVNVTRNGQQINTFTVNSLNAGATTDLVIPRAESRVCATLDPSNPSVCHRCGSGVQGIPVWNDLGIQVTVDSGNVITESNESNNVQTIQ